MKKHNNQNQFFASESVSEGHPDKICDQISDNILDFCLANNENARVACEVFISNKNIIIGGEISPKPKDEDIIKIVKQTLKKINYNHKYDLFSENDCEITNLIQEQSADIHNKVDKKNGELGAGDQGIMFGYATAYGPEYMPLPIMIAHDLLKLASKLRKQNKFPFARPDMKSQVVIEYNGNQPVAIESVVLSIQHEKGYNKNSFQSFVKNNIIKEVVNKYKQYGIKFTEDINILINPIGDFIIGGPIADTGLTGRKIIVDTYGGKGRHGGGAFSGKDYTKVDRSASYMCRYIAKNIVAAGIAKECEIEVSYVIGKVKPLSYWVDTKNTSEYSNFEITEMIKTLFDFSIVGITKFLDLKKPIYANTSVYGHFGNKNFSWEKIDCVQKIQEYFKKQKVIK